MKTLQKLVATLTLAGIIIVSVSSAQAGMLMSDFAGGGGTEREVCTEKTEEKVDRGIIFELTGIIFELVGYDRKDSNDTKTERGSDAKLDCGIIFE